MFQQFGLVFRQKFEDLHISNTQTTTVINLNSAFNSCVGMWATNVLLWCLILIRWCPRVAEWTYI